MRRLSLVAAVIALAGTRFAEEMSGEEVGEITVAGVDHIDSPEVVIVLGTDELVSDYEREIALSDPGILIERMFEPPSDTESVFFLGNEMPRLSDGCDLLIRPLVEAREPDYPLPGPEKGRRIRHAGPPPSSVRHRTGHRGR